MERFGQQFFYQQNENAPPVVGVWPIKYCDLLRSNKYLPCGMWKNRIRWTDILANFARQPIRNKKIGWTGCFGFEIIG
jgi:hypothetical protein